MAPADWYYAWNNSADPRMIRARCRADAARAARPRVTLSRPEPGGLSVAYGGLAQGLVHVLPFLESRRGPTASRVQTRSSWHDLLGGRAAGEADILAVGCLQDRLGDRPPSGRELVLPFRVTLAARMDTDPEKVLSRVSRKARQQHARELRSRSRTLEIATREADFDHFYDRMHLPTMRNRHGDSARSESRGRAKRVLFQRGVLCYLCEEGRPVAGLLCRIQGTTLVIRLAGVEAGDERLSRSGCYLALYILVQQWAARHGFTKVDFSGCEPFLSKGIFQFKRKLHPEVALPDNHFASKRLLLRVRRDTPEVRDFLVANPLLTIGGGPGFEALYFHDENRPPRLDVRWECPGIRGRRLQHLDEFF